MQLVIDVPEAIGERLRQLSKPELTRVLEKAICQQEAANQKKPVKSHILAYAGMAKGVHASPEAANTYVREERDSWQ